MSFLIRHATDKDIDAILAVEKKAVAYPVSRSKIESEFSQEKTRILVAEHAGKMIGYLDYWLILEEVEIINIAVDPQFQRQGVGTALFDFLYSSHPSVDRIHLEVRAGNQKAYNFYKKTGFCETGRRKKYYPNEEDAILMSYVKMK